MTPRSLLVLAAVLFSLAVPGVASAQRMPARWAPSHGQYPVQSGVVVQRHGGYPPAYQRPMVYPGRWQQPVVYRQPMYPRAYRQPVVYQRPVMYRQPVYRGGWYR